MAKHGLIGNWHLFNVKGNLVSDGINVICGIKTHFPLFTPLAISASMTQWPKRTTIIRVPLRKPFPGPACKLRSNITGLPILSSISWGGSPDIESEFRNSVGYVCDSSSSAMVSADLYLQLIPGNNVIICAFISSTCSFLGVRIARWAT